MGNASAACNQKGYAESLLVSSVAVQNYVIVQERIMHFCNKTKVWTIHRCTGTCADNDYVLATRVVWLTPETWRVIQ